MSVDNEAGDEPACGLTANGVQQIQLLTHVFVQFTDLVLEVSHCRFTEVGRLNLTFGFSPFRNRLLKFLLRLIPNILVLSVSIIIMQQQVLVEFRLFP